MKRALVFLGAIIGLMFAGGAALAEGAPDEAVRQLTPAQVETLLEANSTNDVEEMRELMNELAIPEKSVVFVNRSGAIVCPVDTNDFRLNLLIISINSSRISGEPSQACRDWIQSLIEDATLDQISEYLTQLGRTDRDRILTTMIRYLAATRFGISPAQFDVMMLDLRPMSELTPQEQLDVVQRRRDEIRIRIEQAREEARQERIRNLPLND